MKGLVSWLNQNWFSFVQSAGIIAGLFFTAATLRQQTALTLTQQHRDLWDAASQRKDLERIFAKDVDLSKPPTVAEEEFLNIAFVHFENGWQMARAGGVLKLAVLARDLKGFFKFPLRLAVWKKTRDSRNPEFVSFVEQEMANKG